jgi:hypothetical protein
MVCDIYIYSEYVFHKCQFVFGSAEHGGVLTLRMMPRFGKYGRVPVLREKLL